MTARSRNSTSQQQPRTAKQRRDKASALAFANIAKHGVEPLRNQLRRGFLARFETQVDAESPGVRTSDPAEFARRVQQALQRHMQALSVKSVASRAAKRAAREHHSA